MRKRVMQTAQKTPPLVALRLKDADFTVFQLSNKLRQKGWVVPGIHLPENAQDVTVMRMVIKENFSRDMVELLFSDVMKVYKSLEQSEAERIEGAKGKEKQSLLYEGLISPSVPLVGD